MEKKIWGAIKTHSNLNIEGFSDEALQVFISVFLIHIKDKIKQGTEKFNKKIEGGIL